MRVPNRLSLVATYVTTVQKYANYVGETLQRLNADDAATLAVVPDIQFTADLFKSAASLADAAGAFEKMQQIDNWMANVSRIIANLHYAKVALSGKSSYDDTALRHYMSAAATMYAKYMINDVDAIAEFITAIKITDIIKYIFAAPIKSPFILDLIQLIIDRTDAVTRHRLTAIISAEKDQILGSGSVLVPPMALVCLGQIDDIQLAIGDISLPDTEYNCIILYRMVGQPITYDIRGLIDAKFIAEYKTSPSAGISKKFIKRMDTMQLTGVEIEPRISVDVRENAASDQWRIYDTINGITFRTLHVASVEIFTREQVRGIIDGRINNRISRYHTICSESILANCFDAKMPMLRSDYASAQLSVIRPTVSIKLLYDYLSKFTVISTDSYVHVVDDQGLKQTIRAMFIRADNRNRETLITHLSAGEKYADMFAPILDAQLRKFAPTARTFSDYTGAHLREHINSIYKLAINKAVEIFDKKISGETLAETSFKDYIIGRSS